MIKQKKKNGSKYLKISTYLYLHELYQGKKFKTESLKISLNKSSPTMKFGSNPKLSLAEATVEAFELPFKDINLKANHFLLKINKDSESIQLIPCDLLSE